MDKTYVTVGEAGEGTYGTVTKCVVAATGRAVAVKRMRNALSDRRHCEMIVREVAALRRLDGHDHVVPMVDAFRHRGRVHLVFPLMQNNLYAYLQERDGGALTVDETRWCMYQFSLLWTVRNNALSHNNPRLEYEPCTQVLKGLSYIHNQNVVHRDIKPENLLLSATGIVKICDFGASRMFCLDQSLDMSTEVGTVWYQAPEVLMNSENYNTSVDIWSVGILFTELVGSLPLVTEDTVIEQLCCIIKILDCGGDNLVLFEKHLHEYGIVLKTAAQLSKSYILSSTTLALKKLYSQWPTCLLELVAHCLQLNPANRKNAAQLLDMVFFTGEAFPSLYEKELKIKLEYD